MPTAVGKCLLFLLFLLHGYKSGSLGASEVGHNKCQVLSCKCQQVYTVEHPAFISFFQLFNWTILDHSSYWMFPSSHFGNRLCYKGMPRDISWILPLKMFEGHPPYTTICLIRNIWYTSHFACSSPGTQVYYSRAGKKKMLLLSLAFAINSATSCQQIF